MVKRLVLSHIEKKETEPITSEKILDKHRFHPDGLYSEKVFGPIKDHVCQCGTYDPLGGVCPKCGVRFCKSEVRATKMGHIPLPIEIINPLFMWSLNSRSKCNTKIDINSIIFYKNYMIFEDDGPHMYPVDETDEVVDGEIKYIGAPGIIKLLSWFDEQFKLDDKFKIQAWIKPAEYRLLMTYRDYLIVDRVLVSPPDLRPILFTGNKMMVQETLTRHYTTLLNKINIMNNKIKYIRGVGDLTFKNYGDIQRMAGDIYEEILKIFGGKTGIIRGNMLGKRIDYSGRAVISIDPSLKFNECRIPYHILLEVYKYSLGREIAKDRKSIIFTILEEIEDSLKNKDYRFIKDVEKFSKNKYVALNRQPTLHKYGLRAFKMKVSSDSTIKIHPLCCEMYNADFDGDSFFGAVDLSFNRHTLIKDGIKYENNMVVQMEDLLHVEVA